MPALEQGRLAAQAGGLAAGLRAVLDGSQLAPCSAGGRALLPEGLAASVPGWRFPDRAVPRAAVTVTVVPHALAAAEGLESVQVTESVPGRGALSGPEAGTPAALALAGVRIGVAQRLLERAADYLGRRSSAGSPLAGRQLVQGAIADAAAVLELCAAVPRSCSPGSVADLHRRLSETEWSIASLFGGSGYLRDGPARCLYLARLVADAWVRPADPGRWG